MFEENQKLSDFTHIPILQEEIIDFFKKKKRNDGLSHCPFVIDGTFGCGGHSKALLHHNFNILAIDRDADAVWLGEKLKKERQEQHSEAHSPSFFMHHDSFVNWQDLWLPHSKNQDNYLLGLFFDLGLSSMQLDNGARGFSWREDAPLKMTMGLNNFSASDVVNYGSESLLVDIFSLYGQEPQSKTLARLIIKERQKNIFHTTQQLAVFIERNLRPWKKKIHRATLAFQAIRIYVNEEIQQLNLMCGSLSQCAPETCVAFLTFHSLEDRIVKKLFKNQYSDNDSKKDQWQTLGIITPSDLEIQSNPRARSAKLRIGVKK